MAGFTPREAVVEAVGVATADAVATEVDTVATAANLPAAQAPKHLASQQRSPVQTLPMEASVLGTAQLCSIMEMGMDTETETVAPAHQRAHHRLLIPMPAKDSKRQFPNLTNVSRRRIYQWSVSPSS